MEERLVEIVARAIASETLSLAFMEPHPMEGTLAVKCRDEDRKTAFRVATAALTALEEAGYAVVPVEPTEDMELAGRDMVGRTLDAGEVYCAMLASLSGKQGK